MPRTYRRLSARTVEAASKPGMLSDGNGLYLYTAPGGSKSWMFRFRSNGRRHDLGLGPVRLVSLAQARAKALDLAARRHNGTDLLLDRRRRAVAAAGQTFEDVFEQFLAAKAPGWSAPRVRANVEASVRQHATDLLRLPVDRITTEHVMGVLRPIWEGRTMTASKVRQRIEAVLDYAATAGYRSGENPARWRGHLENLLAQPRRVAPVQHYSALPYREIAKFMRALRADNHIEARALELVILTGTRCGDVLGMTTTEVDGDVWTIPARRGKSRRAPHRVPLCARALDLIRGGASEGLVFQRAGGRPLRSKSVATDLLHRDGYAGVTAHGFRSTFRDWCSDVAGAPREVAEAALHHVLGSNTETSYRRTDLLEARRGLMGEWAAFCGPVSEGDA
jgi:integrase